MPTANERQKTLLAEWEAILKSAGWVDYTKQIQKELDAAISNLKINPEYARLLHLQGQVEALEHVLRIPGDIRKGLLRQTIQ
jgi:thioredoxin-like negative regulator of GroEL